MRETAVVGAKNRCSPHAFQIADVAGKWVYPSLNEKYNGI
jgi:hypothetical protein